MLKLIVVDNPEKWDFHIPGTEIVSADSYLSGYTSKKERNVRVFNLSDDYRYQSKGYYVSLVAEARGHRPQPDVKNIVDFKKQTLTKILSEELEKLVNKSLKDVSSDHFKLSVYFGRNTENQYTELAMELYKLFRAPLLRAYFSSGKRGWSLTRIKTINLKEVPETHLFLMKQYAADFLGKKYFYNRQGPKFQYDLAILVDPEEEAPASNKGALQKFIEVGESVNMYVELVEPSDYSRLLTFDALFVRMTTHVNNDSYKFVRKAEAEGLAIIDYSENILKCGNKVFMAEVLKSDHVLTPKSTILYHDNWEKSIPEIELPCILKLPDSAFSYGVKKAENKAELKSILKGMFRESDLVIAQEYIYTEFDWRVGVLDDQPLFVCKYFMAKNHWQIYNWDTKEEDDQMGNAKTFLVEDVPQKIIITALKACALFNKKGLFGVDIKEVNGRLYVIEVNDNPSIDRGVEDLALKDELYRRVLIAFKRRLERRYNYESESHV